MNVVVCIEHHFERTPDGCVWTQAGFSYRFWRRYLDVFDGVRIVARVRDVPSPPSDHVRADGPGVTVKAVPDYLGPWQYLAKVRKVRQAVRSSLGPDDAIILRVSSQLANCMFPQIIRQGRPYAVEVVGDPWDVFAPGAFRHILRPLFRLHFTSQQKSQCSQACAAAYVTQRTLQRRYPVGRGGYSTSYSSVQLAELPPKKPATEATGVEPAFLAVHPVARLADDPLTLSSEVSGAELHSGSSSMQRRLFARGGGTPVQLVMVGTLSQLYKGPDIAIAAVAKCLRDGWEVCLTIVGDGKHRKELEQYVAELGMTDSVIFRGQLPQGAAVQAELDHSDLFLMPSRTEGLPRALIEAMARGLPCVASAVGGIPELLLPEDLVPPGDPAALAKKIQEVLGDPDRMQRMSDRNRIRAQDFREDVLRQRRVEFYRFVRRQTEQWLRRNDTARQVA